jgi:hypothetical protein
MNIRLAAAALIAASLLPIAAMAQRDPSQKPATVRLASENGSPENGTAKLTPLLGGKTKVQISLKDEPKGTSQPAAIRSGSCERLDPQAKYALNDVKGGKSTTTVPANLTGLIGEHLAIDVQKAAHDSQTYVACGQIAADTREQ